MWIDVNSACRLAIVAGVMVLGLAVATPVAAHGGTQHPAAIAAGQCAALSDVVVPLGDAGDQLPINGQPAASDPVGAETAVQVDGSITTVQLSLADLVAGAYAIVIHASAGEIDQGVACGDIGGRMIGDTLLPIGLAEMHDSGTSGIAVLEDNADGTTTVSVFVTRDHAGDGHDDADDHGDDDHTDETEPGY